MITQLSKVRLSSPVKLINNKNREIKVKRNLESRTREVDHTSQEAKDTTSERAISHDTTRKKRKTSKTRLSNREMMMRK